MFIFWGILIKFQFKLESVNYSKRMLFFPLSKLSIGGAQTNYFLLVPPMITGSEKFFKLIYIFPFTFFIIKLNIFTIYTNNKLFFFQCLSSVSIPSTRTHQVGSPLRDDPSSYSNGKLSLIYIDFIFTDKNIFHLN